MLMIKTYIYVTVVATTIVLIIVFLTLCNKDFPTRNSNQHGNVPSYLSVNHNITHRTAALGKGRQLHIMYNYMHITHNYMHIGILIDFIQ